MAETGNSNNDPQKSEPLQGEIIPPGQIIRHSNIAERAIGWLHGLCHVVKDVGIWIARQRELEQRSRTDIAAVKTDVAVVKTEIIEIRSTVAVLGTEVADLRKIIFNSMIAAMLAGTMVICTLLFALLRQ